MSSVRKWFGDDMGKLTLDQAQVAAEMADELEKDYLPQDWWVAMAEALDILEWEV